MIKSNLKEIDQSLLLKIYGALLSLIVTTSCALWLHSDVARILGPGSEAICWPWLDSCQSWRIIPSEFIRIIYWILCGLSLGNAFIFLQGKKIKLAYYGLILIYFLDLACIAFDFRFRLNAHVMAFLMAILYLFFPAKIKSLKLALILFYLWAGILKFDSEWLSGAALYTDPWLIHGALKPWACVYVLILETFLVWGLLANRAWIRWSVLLQLAAFHVLSFSVVGFFYPTVMFLLMMIFPLSWYFNTERIETTWFVKNRQSLAIRIFMVAYSCSQMIPRLIPGDQAITGEGRLFALHMFDSNTTCSVTANLHYSGEPQKLIDLHYEKPIRIRCDPLVYLSRARYLCNKEKLEHPHFSDLDLKILTRRSNESGDHLVLDIKDFCSKKLQYSPLFHNEWINID